MPTKRLSPADQSPTVFIMQQPRPKREDGWLPDFSGAAQYGKLAYIFDQDDRVFQNPTDAIEKAKTRLANFDADRDYLMWPSFCDPASVFIVVQLLALGGNRMLRYLYWVKKGDHNSFYMPMEINMRLDRIKI